MRPLSWAWARRSPRHHWDLAGGLNLGVRMPRVRKDWALWRSLVLNKRVRLAGRCWPARRLYPAKPRDWDGTTNTRRLARTSGGHHVGRSMNAGLRTRHHHSSVRQHILLGVGQTLPREAGPERRSLYWSLGRPWSWDHITWPLSHRQRTVRVRGALLGRHADSSPSCD